MSSDRRRDEVEIFCGFRRRALDHPGVEFVLRVELRHDPPKLRCVAILVRPDLVDVEVIRQAAAATEINLGPIAGLEAAMQRWTVDELPMILAWHAAEAAKGAEQLLRGDRSCTKTPTSLLPDEAEHAAVLRQGRLDRLAELTARVAAEERADPGTFPDLAVELISREVIDSMELLRLTSTE